MYQLPGQPGEKQDLWWQNAARLGWEPWHEPTTDTDTLTGKLYANNHDNERRMESPTLFDWDAEVWKNLQLLDPCVARRTC
jgi:hypothetical protein